MRTVANRDLAALRSFVTAQDGNAYQGAHPDTVIVDITHSNLQQRHLEIRLSKHSPLQEVYHLIHQKTGSAVDDQILQMFGVAGDMVVSALPAYADATRPLAFYGLDQHGMRVHCIDTNPHAISSRGALENVKLVKKFQLTDEQYEARSGTLRSWAKQQKAQDPSFSLQRHAEQHKALQEAKHMHKLGLEIPQGFELRDGVVTALEVAEENPDFSQDSVQHCKVGDRCQIQPGGRRGEVKWIGEIPNKDYWVGISLDEPVGHNDGTFAGNQVRCFNTVDKHGVFCRGKNVETGDFPEEDLFDSDDEL